jgi:tetratricopeptide (TPR) repeat protein
MRQLPIAAALSFSLGCGLCLAKSADEDRFTACYELVENGTRLTSSLYPDDRERGREYLRRAEEVCEHEAVPVQLRAWARMLATRLYDDEPRLQRDFWYEAVSLLEAEAPDSELLPKALEGLSSAEFDLGRFDECLRLAQQALEVRVRVFGAGGRHHVRGLTYLAVAYLSLAEVEETPKAHLERAQVHAEEAMTIARRTLGLDDGTTVATAANLGAVLRSRGLTEEAERLLEEIAPYVDLDDPLDLR